VKPEGSTVRTECNTGELGGKGITPFIGEVKILRTWIGSPVGGAYTKQ